MANMMICSTKLGDEATLDGGSWTATLPLDNAKTPDQFIPARSASAATADTQFTATLDRARPVQVLGLGYHNLTSTATIRVRGENDGTQTFDQTFNAYDAIYRTVDLNWFDPNLIFGTPTEEDLQDIPRVSFVVLDNRYYADEITFEINDNTNALGYVEFGRLLTSDPYQPSLNMAYGMQESLVDPTTVERTTAGSRLYDEKRLLRSAQLELTDLPEYELRMTAHEIQRRRGVSGQMFFIPDHEDLRTRYLKSFFCTLEAMSPLTRAFHERANLPFSFLEI